jgi:hypothetical protein
MQRKLGWNWVWFLPLCAAALLIAERHTLLYGYRVGVVAYQRWSWAALVSPSAYFCWSVILGSVYWPIQGLSIVSVIAKADTVTANKRFLYVLLLALTIFLLPFVSDALIWGSFPFNIDDAGVSRLRLIPFFPWPDGQFGQF